MSNQQNKNKLEKKGVSNEKNYLKDGKSIDLSKRGFLKASIPVMALAVVVLFATLKNHGYLFFWDFRIIN